MRIRTKSCVEMMEEARRIDDLVGSLRPAKGERSEAAASGSASSEGCPDARAAGNPNDVSASVVPTKSGSAALERIARLCGNYMDSEKTQEDPEADADAKWLVIKQVSEIANVEIARLAAPPTLPRSGERAGRDNIVLGNPSAKTKDVNALDKTT